MIVVQINPEAQLVLHSQASNTGIDAYTFLCRYWRPIHSEVMTHRKFGRNARSSRAVPNRVLLREPIVEPLEYGSNRPGMQSGDVLTGWRLLLARNTWITLARINRIGVRLLNFAGLHKQWSNRPLEWFGCIDVLITTTDMANWLALRDHPAAAPEIRELARAMRRAINDSTPQILMPGEWHLPYIRKHELVLGHDACVKLSVARCARLSYKPFDGSDSLDAEIARYDKLLGSRPVHASPAEHQLTPDAVDKQGRFAQPHLHGNLRGWVQYRKLVPGECVEG
jgi:hypothetical protein